MKIYAEFINDESLMFRTRTLLQFGDSWDLIGSIIMKNPGSAKPGNKIDSEICKKLSKYYNEIINLDNWFVSEGDSTMRDIEPIFNGNYVSKDFELNGVIQIFNLFNICEPKLNSAFEKANTTNSIFLLPNVEEMINSFQNKPVYLGFFDFYTNKKSNHFSFLQESANKIFEFVKTSKFNYFQFEDIIDNAFYHPQFLNKPTKREKYLATLEKFAKFYESN